MIGALVPVAFLPRFTSYVGVGQFVTEPVAVDPYAMGRVLFWRGPLVGGAASNPFRAYFEESQDGVAWSQAGASVSQPVTTADTVDAIGVVFQKKWLRIRVVLAADTNGVVGITLWMVGELQQRVS